MSAAGSKRNKKRAMKADVVETYFSSSDEETRQFGAQIGKRLSTHTIIALSGDLGAGKTTFIKGLAEGALGIDPSVVNSPTFTYLNIYSSSQGTLYHFDLYRLQNGSEFLAKGFEEFLENRGMCCIEWSERISSLLPPHTLYTHLSYEGPTGRRITVRTE